MGAVAAEANDFWARVQSAENQHLPDTKARVRFLLDEIALLETRFESRKQQQQGEPPEILQELLPDVSSEKQEEQVEQELVSELSEEAEQQLVENASNEASVNEISSSSDLDTGTKSVHTRCDDFLVFIEEKLRTLVDERVGFFETAENALRIGKVERLELAKLLRLEKSKLQQHRLELDEWSCWQSEEGATRSCVWKAVQEVIEKFVKLLDEREGLLLKFEAQVELGHFFRLLKLLEVQKARDENSKRELEKRIQEFRELVEKERRPEPVDDTNCGLEDFQEEFEIAGDSNRESEQEMNSPVGVEEIVADRDSETAMESDVSTAGDFRECRKEAKQEILKLMAEQEQRWKDQLSFLQEMEHRLASSELETQRVNSRLEERCRDCDCNRKAEATIAPVSADIPQGYTSIYFSPIFQERKQNPKAQRDEKDVEIQRLRKEIGRLKEDVSNHERQASDGTQNHPEEKTILVDSSFKPEEVDVSSSGSFAGSESVCSSLSEDDKKFCEQALQKMFLIVHQHRWELSSSNLRASAEVKQAFAGAFRNMSLEFSQLSEDLQAHFNIKAPQEASGNEMKADMDRLAGEHAQQLERKEKTLVYAQELNMQLANDMSKTENALTDLRSEHTAVKLSLETKLKASESEAEALAEMLRREIASLETKLSDRDRAMLETTRRAEACQRETDAAVLEKNSCLERLQRALSELEEQNQKLEREDHERCEGAASQLQEAREELKRSSEARQALERRYGELQSKLLETEYELAQREAALERLTLHLAASTAEAGVSQEMEMESLRSKHRRKEQARKSIQEAEVKMLEIAAEMSSAKSEMAEMKSQSFQLLRKLRIK